MNDFIQHKIYNLSPLDLLIICIICFAIGLGISLIILVERSQIKYTEYDKKPHKMNLVIGHRGSTPVYAEMWSREFVDFLWGRLKGCQAKIKAMKKITGEET